MPRKSCHVAGSLPVSRVFLDSPCRAGCSATDSAEDDITFQHLVARTRDFLALSDSYNSITFNKFIKRRANFRDTLGP